MRAWCGCMRPSGRQGKQLKVWPRSPKSALRIGRGKHDVGDLQVGSAACFTSPRLRGGGGSHSKCDPGEGVQSSQLAPASRIVPLSVAEASHRRPSIKNGGRRPPTPSPRKRGEGEG